MWAYHCINEVSTSSMHMPTLVCVLLLPFCMSILISSPTSATVIVTGMVVGGVVVVSKIKWNKFICCVTCFIWQCWKMFIHLKNELYKHLNFIIQFSSPWKQVYCVFFVFFLTFCMQVFWHAWMATWT